MYPAPRGYPWRDSPNRAGHRRRPSVRPTPPEPRVGLADAELLTLSGITGVELMRLDFQSETLPRTHGVRCKKIRISLDGAYVGYIEGLDETYVIHMPTGGEVGPYRSLGEAKQAVRVGLRAGVLGRNGR